MKRTRKPKSQLMIEQLRKAKFHARKAVECLSCYKAEDLGFAYIGENHHRMDQANQKFYEAEQLVEEAYASLIGRQIVSEL